jgi:hypothetical protein
LKRYYKKKYKKSIESDTEEAKDKEPKVVTVDDNYNEEKRLNLLK